jgi:hypothetical protein
VWTGSTWDSPSSDNVLQVPIGLEFITASSFVSATAVSVNNVFSSKYENYKIVFTAVGSAGDNLFFRLRANGSDITATNYNYQQVQFRSTSLTGFRATAQNTHIIGAVRANEPTLTELTVGTPFLTAKTTFHSNTIEALDSISLQMNGGIYSATTSVTGFTIYCNAITGSVRVYGMRN